MENSLLLYLAISASFILELVLELVIYSIFITVDKIVFTSFGY